MPGKIISVWGDSHVGSTVGLCPPGEHITADGIVFTQNAAQVILWEEFVKYCDFVKQSRRGKSMVVILNGDLLDGDHHNSGQIIPRDESEQAELFYKVWDFFCSATGFNKKRDSVFVIRGTDKQKTHGSKYIVNTIAERIGAVPGPSFNTWDLLRVDLDGHLLEFTHHAPAGIGRREWSRGNGVRSWVRSKVQSLVNRGERVPSAFIWSHVHVTHFERESLFVGGGEKAEVYAGSLPAFQLATDHVLQALPWEPGTSIGGAVIYVSGGKLNVIVKAKEVYNPGLTEVVVL